MRIVVLSGGVGGSRFIRGLLAATAPDDDITVVANTADDLWLFGLRVCPDLDTVMYTLGDGIDPGRGWGRTQETWNAKEELAAYGTPQAWFGLGDRDLATHLVRSELLRSGAGLTEATDRLCRRWAPGTDLARIRLLPMTEDEVETWISTTVDGQDVDLHFQEFWIRHQASVPVHAVTQRGIETSRPAPGVQEAIAFADVVILPPSNPIVSVGPILAVPGVREALRGGVAPVVGVSPIIDGGAVRGMADQLLAGLNVENSAAAVAELHGSRSGDGVLDGWLVDESDADLLPRITGAGISARAVPLWMRDAATTQRLAEDTLDLARGLVRG
ncbi:MAG: 2-phospho-L-lactate transferase [Aeromicrobium sp.]|uniref:2-phospho-L-lactate transferase n=1 Tax=Aeromicrobium sp. TaxID=1871063 RepID=UPI002605CAD7|nr:2-phospho-L-lactate transferase [Aeromicrobium sp.]MDF1704676.1 2-phospho-L-lactate transferase [Aeromicrobium sp.]